MTPPLSQRTGALWVALALLPLAGCGGDPSTTPSGGSVTVTCPSPEVKNTGGNNWTMQTIAPQANDVPMSLDTTLASCAITQVSQIELKVCLDPLTSTGVGDIVSTTLTLGWKLVLQPAGAATVALSLAPAVLQDMGSTCGGGVGRWYRQVQNVSLAYPGGSTPWRLRVSNPSLTETAGVYAWSFVLTGQ